MLKNYGLAFKLNTLIILVTGLIFICAILYNSRSTYKILKAEAQDDSEIIGQIAAENIQHIRNLTEMTAETLARIAGRRIPSQERIKDMLTSVVNSHPEIYGVSIAFAPFAYDGKMQFYCPYVYRAKEGINFINDMNDSEDYTQNSWYSVPSSKQKPFWTDPYFEKDPVNIMLVTYSAPFFIKEGDKEKLRGVVVVDLSIEWLNSMLEDINAHGTGYAFVLSKEGKIILSPKSEMLSEHICGQTIFEYAEKVKTPAIAELGNEILSNKSGLKFVKFEESKKSGWFYYSHIGKNGDWCLVVFFPDDKYREDLNNLNIEMILICFIGMLLLILLVTLIIKKLTAPLKKLARSVRLIGRGKLDIQISVIDSNDEAGILTKAFEEMRKSLNNYIENLRKTTAEKESYETEIKIAASLQSSIIPIIDEKFKSSLFEIYAKLVPAKEVSGDFYDIFYLEDNTLALVVADVSGKGVPAAFFMSMAKFAIKNICSAKSKLSPSKVLELVNNLICAENPKCMFLTCYLAFYDILKGELTYTNAGHHGLLHRLSSGEVEIEGFQENKAIGIFPDAVYSESKIVLGTGDMIAIYTDGIIEAEDKISNQFGEEAVIAHFKAHQSGDINRLGDSLISKVMEFEGNNKFDDITLLILKRSQGD